MEPQHPTTGDNQTNTQAVYNQPVPPAGPPQAGPAQPPQAPQKKHTGLIIGIIVAVVVLLVGGIIGTVVAFRSIQSKATQLVKERESSASKEKANTTEQNESTMQVAAHCIAPSDLTAGLDYYPDMGIDSFNGTNYLIADNVFFLPDSTAYEFPDQDVERFDTLAQFYKNNSKKQFVFELSGSTHENSTSDAGAILATQRVEKVKQELVSRGVPVDRFITAEARMDADSEASRNVGITLMKSGSCAIVE